MIARAEGETGMVRYGRRTLPFTLHRTNRQKTVSIAVDPRDGVHVKAPASVARDRVDDIVRRKAPWILERIARSADLPPPPSPREFVSGETFLYLGRQHRLRVVVADGEEGVRLAHGRFVVTVKPNSGPRRVRSLLVRWFRDRAEGRIPAVAARWAARMGLGEVRVLIRDQKQRWGSCDAAGVVRINWRVVQAAPGLIEYVVAHELTHVRHPSHTAAFWATLGRWIPEYERLRHGLRVIGVRMTW